MKPNNPNYKPACLALIQAWVDDKLEYQNNVEGWQKYVSNTPPFINNPDLYRIVRERVQGCIPWTFETSPATQIRVRRKKDGTMYLAELRPQSVEFYSEYGATPTGSYASLLSDYTQLDGSPCGEVQR